MTIKEQIRKKNGRPTKHQQRYKNTGRPTVMTPEVVKQLTEAFEMGMSVINSCIHAGVSKQVYFDYCKKNPEFHDRCKDLQQKPAIKAILVINQALKEGDVSTAKWYAERKIKDEFSLKTETEHSGEVKSKVVYIEKEEKENYKKHIDKIIDGD